MGRLRHLAYASGWKKFEPLCDLIVRTRRAAHMLPRLETTLETTLEDFGRHPSGGKVVSVPPKKPATKVEFAAAELYDR